MHIWEPRTRKGSETDTENGVSVTSELRMRLGPLASGGRRAECPSQTGKKSRCSVISCSPCHTAPSNKKLISGDNWYYGQGPKFKFFKGEAQVSLEPRGSPLPSAEENLHTTEAHPAATPTDEPCYVPKAWFHCSDSVKMLRERC